MTSTQARHTRWAAGEQQITGMSVTTLSPQLTGKCPQCHGDFESCTCTGAVPAPRAGKAADVGREIGRQDDRGGDDGRGFERDETDQFHQIVRGLVDDGDRRAHAAGRQARRTLAEMAPGQTRQPVLRMARQLSFTPTAPAGLVAGGQCSSCQGAGGKMIDTSSDGVTRQHWQSCTACGGTGATR
ncbi:hypothetical protein [Streptomyces sp. NPDC088730]|uniref:hypothetical protein n=1 Tax=Streptomyces sp. NPDC088730 TaxID=3365877 RepID=UPI0037FB5B73